MDSLPQRFESGTTHDLTVTIVEHSPETGTAVRVADLNGTAYWLLGTTESLDPTTLGSETHYDLSGVLVYDPAQPEPGRVRDARNRSAPCPECSAEMVFEDDTQDPPGELVAEIAALPTTDPVLILTADSGVTETSQVDDWRPQQTDAQRDRSLPGVYVCPNCSHETDQIPHPELLQSMNCEMAPVESPSIGLAAGGGKDVNNFRDNIEEGFVPQPDALTYEGLFYDYHFETATGQSGEADGLFTPTYSGATTTHPLTGETERYLSVGLDSSLTVDDFERKQLNLVAILDVSGSMSSPFDQYYYDQHGVRREVDDPSAETKMAAASKALCALTERLDADDRLGIVLYNSSAQVAKPIRRVGDTDMPAIRRHLRDVQAGGGTNMAAGFTAARDLLAPFEGDDPETVENRVVFMTDAMPNTGVTGETALVDRVDDAAQDGVHTTFVGMGLDANAELVDALSGVRGANHYFVHSAAEFERRLGDEFDYMVTPLVYDLSLELDTEDSEIEAVYGSPNADTATGEVMHVSTLFPSPTDDGETRGGIVLVELGTSAPEDGLDLVASWTERDGTSHTQRVTADLPSEPEAFDHDGIRKAIALTRYARTLRAWAGRLHGTTTDETAGVDDWQLENTRGEHERTSLPLSVPLEYVEQFDQLRAYLATERDHLGDETLDRELDLLHRLTTTARSEA